MRFSFRVLLSSSAFTSAVVIGSELLHQYQYLCKFLYMVYCKGFEDTASSLFSMS